MDERPDYIVFTEDKLDQKPEYILFTKDGLYRMLGEMELTAAREQIPVEVIMQKVDEHRVHFSAIQVFHLHEKVKDD